MVFADMHSHFLINAYYLGRRFKRNADEVIRWGPFGNLLEQTECLKADLRCVTFTIYSFPSFLYKKTDQWVSHIKTFFEMIARSDGKLRNVRSGREARAVIESGGIAGVLAMEGGHHLDGKLENVGVFARLGVRMITLTHFVSNEICGSCDDLRNRKGLTEFGRLVVKEMSHHGIFPDVAHADALTIDQVCDLSEIPVVCSHTGMKAISDINRNLSDEQAKKIAGTGGLIGIILFPPYLERGAFSTNLSKVLDHIVHLANVVGPQYCAIGSDMDGFTWMPKGFRGPKDFSKIAEGLLKRGFSEDEVRGIMSENYLKLLDIDGNQKTDHRV